MSDLLEEANNKNRLDVDLSTHPCQLPYTVNLRMMIQTRHGSNYVRMVRRIQTGTTYPAAGAATTGPGGGGGRGSGAHTTGGGGPHKSTGGGVQKKKNVSHHGQMLVNALANAKMTRQTVRNLQVAQQQQQQQTQQQQQQPGEWEVAC